MDADDPQDHRLDADRHSVVNRRRLSGAGLRTFVRITDLWALDEDQRRLVLGLPDSSTYQASLEAARKHRDLELSVDVLMRISAVLGIHAALGILHAEERDGVAWLADVLGRPATRPRRAPGRGRRPPCLRRRPIRRRGPAQPQASPSRLKLTPFKQAVRAFLIQQGTRPVISPMPNRRAIPRFDAAVYRQRNLIERAFCRIKDWRAIATRYDKTPATSSPGSASQPRSSGGSNESTT